MYVILGAAGNVGSEVVRALAAKDLPVLAVVHSAGKTDAVSGGTVEVAVVDVTDSAALRETFKRGKRAFLLNPPGDPSGDSNSSELLSGGSIVDALKGSGLEKVVVASTYGAHRGSGIGDLSTLYDFEQGVLASGIPAAINRGAYYFSNLDMLLDTAQEGVLPTAFPEDLLLPMVAASDLGRAAAERLISGTDDVGITYVEGPERYSFADVAKAVGNSLGRNVSVATTPRDRWEQSFRDVGFSEVSARSFARMTAATLEGPELPDHPWRGSVTLDAYLRGRLE